MPQVGSVGSLKIRLLDTLQIYVSFLLKRADLKRRVKLLCLAKQADAYAVMSPRWGACSIFQVLLFLIARAI